MSGAKVFFDTNVLAYAQDHDAAEKRERSRQLIADVVASGTGVISTQVLQEYYVTATRKMRVAPLAAKRVVQSFTIFEVVQISPALIEQAIDRSVLSQLSFWDALIVAASASSGCTIIYSEDLNAGQLIDGVRLVNPFV
ncbi:MAG: PIN domain-containing protein [Phycisphaerae bacterium]|nr:PIN domain-containing protein [Phycisphaerae bacterium]